jgi:aminoglycoside/choline kinase family phosphotransferase
MTATPPCADPAVIAAFLSSHGLAEVERRPLAGDASTRRYHRLIRPDGDPLILMQAPDPARELVPFLVVADLIRPLGLSVPLIVAADPELGLLLLEDFGDETFSSALDRDADPEPLYNLAVDVLITLHQGFAPGPATAAALPAYDAAAFTEQVLLLADQVMPDRPESRYAFETAWSSVIPAVMTAPPTLLLRDYHAGNLMLLPGRRGVQSCGLLDFQDAGLGPPAYDLVSLIEDARRDLAPELAGALLRRYLDAFPELEPAALARAWTVLAAIRHTRVIAVFLRLARHGKPGYLRHLPRLWRYLDTCLARPELAPVAAWFERYLPPLRRMTLADEIVAEAKL